MSATTLPERRWLYRCKPTRIVDADSIDCLLDMGFHVQRTERLRLLGIDAPEQRGATREAGLAATRYVMAWLSAANPTQVEDWPLLVETYKSDVFGRFLADVWRISDGASLSHDLLAAGHAVPWVRGG